MKNIVLLLLAIGLSSGCGVTKRYEEAKASNSIQTYEDYISKYPKSKYLQQAKDELAELYEERDWSSARKSNAISGYNRFISDYPYSKYTSEAEKRIKKIEEENAWSKSVNINSINSYENFISSYPASHYVLDAKNKIQKLKDNLAWEEAELESTVESYRKYISAFPNGLKKAIALDKIKEIEVIRPAWDRTLKSNTPDSYRSFIGQYRHSSYSVVAQQKLEGLESDYWKQAESKNSISQYQKYISNFPNGRHIPEAEKEIIDIEVDNIFKGDHGKLPPMSKTASGYSYTTSNDIEIYNNTTYTLTVRYSGSGSLESKKIVLAPKQKQTFTLQNGDYRVAASVNVANVTNYAGKEKLEGGSYSSEFFIETSTYWGR